MKKLLFSTTFAVALVATGCGGEKISTVAEETTVDKPFARVIFDPENANLNVPNDLLMLPASDLFDFTIELEADPFDPTDPQQALGALDGWSTNQPFAVNFELPSGLELDGNSAAAPGAIRLFESTQALEGTSTACMQLAASLGAPGVPCELGDELTYGVDFITSKTAPGSVSVVPLRPLKAGQGYLLVVTDALLDTDGRGVRGSTTWELGRLDIATDPLATESQLQLQTLVNAIVNPVIATGVARESIAYAAYFSTQSTGTVVGTVKQLQIGGFAAAYAAALAQGADAATALSTAAAFLPTLAVTDGIANNAFDILASSLLSEDELLALAAVGLETCDDMLAVLADPANSLSTVAAETFAQVGAFCATSTKAGTIDLPYYLDPADPLGGWWRAACTNGAMLQALGSDTVTSLVTAGEVGANNDLCQAATGGQLLDLNLAAIGIDDPRNLTKVSPVPAVAGSNPDGTESLSVQITVPDIATIAVLASLSDQVSPVVKPVDGWPVVLIQHGITSKKEDVLAVTGALSLAGFATVAIDHPLHGSRGFTINGQVVNASNGFGGAPTDYLNLASLITARDNLRQSIVDIMGLRLGLNAVLDMTESGIDLDATNVHFLGQSLGAITGIGSLAQANTTLGGDLAAFDGMFEFQAAALSVPGGGIAGFLLESATFAPIVKGSLLAASDADFQTFLGQYAQDNALQVNDAIAPAYLAYEAGLSADQLAVVNAVFTAFGFAAQTVIDAGDPINYSALMGAGTPVLMHEVIGGGTNDDGSAAMPDAVIPNTTSLPLAGTEPLAAVMGLTAVSSTTEGSGLVRFIAGDHGSLLNPSASVAATTEMQRQIATFFATQGSVIAINDTSVVAN